MSFPYYSNPSFEYESNLEIDISADIQFDADITLDVYKDVDVDVDVNTYVEGNSAFLVADVQAIGKDTFVEVDASVVTIENQLSSITLHAVSIVN